MSKSKKTRVSIKSNRPESSPIKVKKKPKYLYRFDNGNLMYVLDYTIDKEKGSKINLATLSENIRSDIEYLYKNHGYSIHGEYIVGEANNE